MEKNLFGNHPVTKTTSLPPAFDSDPLISRGKAIDSNSVEGFSPANGAGPSTVSDIVEIDGSASAGNFMKASSPTAVSWFYFQLLHPMTHTHTRCFS